MATKRQTEATRLIVQMRQTRRRQAVQQLRRKGLIPGIVYGRAMEPLLVQMDAKALHRALHTKAGERALVTLQVEPTPAAEPTDGTGHGPAAARVGAPDVSGRKPATRARRRTGLGAGGSPPAATVEKPVLIKAVQHDPVDGHILHIDFHAIALTERIKVRIPVVLRGEPVGVRQEGGLLEHFMRQIEVECLPTKIPEQIEYDVSALTVGDTVHVKDLPRPPDADIVSDPEAAIASVQKAKVEVVEAPPVAAEEPEVIREKREADEEAEGAKKPGEAQKPKAEEKKPEKKPEKKSE